MRRISMGLNAIAAVFFAGFSIYTFVARQHLDGLARQFVTEKTLQFSEPAVELADEALRSPVVQKLLSDRQRAAIRHETAEYRKDPPAYIADLTRQKLLPNPRNPNPLLHKVASLKEQIRSFYDQTLAELIADLRIFSMSNMCAALVAFGLSYWSPGPARRSIAWFSFLMFVAVLYCTWMYIDDLTFFRILFRTHMGWWYPLSLCVAIAGLYLEYGRRGHAEEPAA